MLELGKVEVAIGELLEAPVESAGHVGGGEDDRGLLRWPEEVGAAAGDGNELGRVVGPVLDVRGQHLELIEPGGLRRGNGRGPGLLAFGEDPCGPCRVVHGDALHLQRVEELRALIEGLRVRVDGADLVERGARQGEQAVRDPHDGLADDRHAMADQQVVALVDRPGMAVLQRHHPKGDGADLDGLEHPVHRVEGHRRGLGEEAFDRALAVGPGLPLEANRDRTLGDLDGRGHWRRT